MPGREQHLGLTARRRREGRERVSKEKKICKYKNLQYINKKTKSTITREEKGKERNKEKKKKVKV